MAKPTFYNRAKMSVASAPGTGPITLGTAAMGFQTFAAAGLVDTAITAYVIEDGEAWEIGYGRTSGSGTIFTRLSLIQTSAGATGGVYAPLDVSATASIFLTAIAEDLEVIPNARVNATEAFRYYKIICQTNQPVGNNGYSGVAKIRLATAVGAQTPACTNADGTAASNIFSPSGGGYEVHDLGPQTFTLDFTTPQVFVEIEVDSIGGYAKEAFTNIDIQGSNDNTTYEEIQTLSPTAPGGSAGQLDFPGDYSTATRTIELTPLIGPGAGANNTSAVPLSSLTDVDVTTPLDGQVLTFKSAEGKWVAAVSSGGGGGGGGSGGSLVSGFLDLSVGVPTSFTNVNIGTGAGTIAQTTTDALVIQGPATAPGSITLYGVAIPAPAPPYRVAVFGAPNFQPLRYSGLSMGFRESSTGKLIVLSNFFGTGLSFPGFSLENWASPTSRSDNNEPAGRIFSQGPWWMGIEDNGTTCQFTYSIDGSNFSPLGFSFAKAGASLTTFDEVFFGLVADGGDSGDGAASNGIAATYFCVDPAGLTRKAGGSGGGGLGSLPVGAHRYWALHNCQPQANGSDGSNVVAMAQLQMVAPDLATVRIPIGAYYRPTFYNNNTQAPSAALFDWNSSINNGALFAGRSGGTLRMDMGTPVAIGGVRMLTRTDGGQGSAVECLQDFELMFSDDGIHWTYAGYVDFVAQMAMTGDAQYVNNSQWWGATVPQTYVPNAPSTGSSPITFVGTIATSADYAWSLTSTGAFAGPGAIVVPTTPPGASNPGVHP